MVLKVTAIVSKYPMTNITTIAQETLDYADSKPRINIMAKILGINICCLHTRDEDTVQANNKRIEVYDEIDYDIGVKWSHLW